MARIPQDIIGDIAILKFPRRSLWIVKKILAWRFLKNHKNVKTVLEKTEGFSGELRTLKTKHLSGLRTKEAIYRENNSIFHFNVDTSYFSPRLSNERKVISEDVEKLVKKKDVKILVMFAGVFPYPIAITRRLKEKKKSALIYVNELNEEALKYGEKNVRLNKMGDYIKIVGGDARDIPKKVKEKFDIILMPRPQLDDTFLKTALKLSKKGTIIFYHGFGTKEEVISEIKRDMGTRMKNFSIRKAGDVGPHRFRWQAQFEVE